LAAVDQWLKSRDPSRYSQWLIIPSTVVVALMLPWILGDYFGVGFRAPLDEYSWPMSAPFVAFSFVSLRSIWRTRHHILIRMAFFLWHAFAVLLFVAPLLFSIWFAYQMRDH
jgi:hypothetical protein